jgi:hypothetical protein
MKISGRIDIEEKQMTKPDYWKNNRINNIEISV